MSHFFLAKHCMYMKIKNLFDREMFLTVLF
jgi:hypothetical protein